MLYSELGNDGLMVELDDLKGLFKPTQLYDSMKSVGSSAFSEPNLSQNLGISVTCFNDFRRNDLFEMGWRWEKKKDK